MSTLIAGTYTGAATAIASAILSGYSTPIATGTDIRSTLFSNGEKGVIFDPSDLSTMFQDSAGTTPVTAVGQPVGLLLDKSQGLLLGPELVTNGDFSQGSTGWTLDASASVSGGTLNINNTVSTISAYQIIPLVVGQTYEIATTCTSYSSGAVAVQTMTGTVVEAFTITGAGVYKAIIATGAANDGIRAISTGAGFVGTLDNISVKALVGNHATQATSTARPTLGRHPITGVRNLLIGTDALATQSYTTAAVAYTLSFTGTGTVTLSGAYVGSLVGTGASNRVSLTFTSTAASLTLTVSGSVTFAQLEKGSAVTNYQSVVSQFDITEAGVNYAYYLYGDGVDNSMVTPSIDFTATDKMSVFAGLFTNNPNGLMVCELSATSDTNPGAFFLVSPTNVSGARFRSAGTALAEADTGGILEVGTSRFVYTGIGDIAAPYVGIRRNGTLFTNTATQGTGNYGNYPLYLLARGGTTIPFLGNLYGLIVRGAASSATEIATAEQWMNSKTGAY